MSTMLSFTASTDCGGAANAVSIRRAGWHLVFAPRSCNCENVVRAKRELTGFGRWPQQGGSPAGSAGAQLLALARAETIRPQLWLMSWNITLLHYSCVGYTNSTPASAPG
jgi:hypothetical protein